MGLQTLILYQRGIHCEGFGEELASLLEVARCGSRLTGSVVASHCEGVVVVPHGLGRYSVFDFRRGRMRGAWL